MKLNIIVLHVILAMIFFFGSCVYYPHLTDIPLIREKYDTKLELGVTPLPPTAHATVSYGATKNIAIQAVGTIGADNKYYSHGAIGLFKNNQNRKVMELYGGFGYGYSMLSNLSDPGSLCGNYHVYFTQFNMGRIDKKNMEYGFGLKSGYLQSKMTNNNYINDYPDSIYYLKRIIIEPTFFVRFGWEKFKFQIGIGGCWMFKVNHTDKTIPWSPLNLGISINYNFFINKKGE